MRPPGVVEELLASYLAEVDRAVPDLVGALYLTGSLALDDFQPEISDVDAVAVCTREPRGSDLEALAAVHRPSRPSVDVLYLTWEDLRRNPLDAPAPHSHEGVFHEDRAFAANPVEWRTLQTRAVAVRGPEITREDVWFDEDVLRQWNMSNLDGYWRGRLDWIRHAEPTEAIIRWEYGLQWLVLGVPRLHHTISTLEITSKSGAGRYALDVVDHRWHSVIEASMALRADRAAPLPAPPGELRDAAVELVEWLIDDAHRLIAT